MNQDRLSILERLGIFAEAGETSAKLKLYPRQEQRLIKKGFKVTRLTNISRDLYKCQIEWKEAKEGTIAYDYYKMAKDFNEKEDEPLAPPYHY